MELILLENILNLGNIGDKVTVKNGYGRNFLLKKGKALWFNKDSCSARWEPRNPATPVIKIFFEDTVINVYV